MEEGGELRIKPWTVTHLPPVIGMAFIFPSLEMASVTIDSVVVIIPKFADTMEATAAKTHVFPMDLSCPVERMDMPA